ncbi:site-specific integrase [Flavobacterium sp. UBA7682]|uniref:site-specific integrase n=1 Tax=Flavobacterium sp. UBA7682 TaxID=1946560 RepID=UPI0025B9DF9B|nr:site-specific integrase [Flavobacterium sp. UBA7682]
MNTNIVISLDTRRQKNDGTYPLILRLGHFDRTLPVPISISIKKVDWDEDKRQVKKSYTGLEGSTRFNNRIQQKRIDALKIIQNLYDKGKLEGMSIHEIKKQILNESSSDSFVHFAEGLITDLKEANRFGTASAYSDALAAIKKFSGIDNLKFERVSFEFLTKWETAHLAKGNSINGFSAYLRAIRAIFNKAIKAGVAAKELYPFDDYKLKGKQTAKRALSAELLKKIINKKFDAESPLFSTRCYFLLSYMMYGMNFIDMAYLRKENIADGRIYYSRSKTSRLFDIKITPNLEKLLSYYITKYPESEYVFPILKREEPELMYKDAKWARNRYNDKLDDLGKACKIDKKLTSYVSRHSFATQAMFQQIPLEAISAMLGHKSLKTTQIYLDNLPNSILDKYNHKLVKDI